MWRSATCYFVFLLAGVVAGTALEGRDDGTAEVMPGGAESETSSPESAEQPIVAGVAAESLCGLSKGKGAAGFGDCEEDPCCGNCPGACEVCIELVFRSFCRPATVGQIGRCRCEDEEVGGAYICVTEGCFCEIINVP